MKKIHLSILSIGAAFLMSGCYYDNLKELRPEGAIPVPCDSMGVISYSLQIKPILNASCNQNCHNPTAGNGNRDLTDYLQVSDAALNNGMNPGDGGPLYGTVSWNPSYGTGNFMPRNGSKLSDCDLAKIRKWATTGALNN